MAIKVGDRVKHYGTKMWGTVLEVVPQLDGTSELKVQRDEPFIPGGNNDPTWWATYHIGWHEPAAPPATDEPTSLPCVCPFPRTDCPACNHLCPACATDEPTPVKT